MSRAELYARLPVTTTVDWWIGLASSSIDGRVLELGAGTGRLTQRLVPVASVVAVDDDEPSLAVLRRRVPRATAVRADVCSLDLGERFGCVLLPAALLNEVGDLDSRRRAMATVGNHLAPGGLVGIEVLNPLWLLAGGHSEGVLEGEREHVRMGAAHRPGRPWSQQVAAELTYEFGDGTRFTDRLEAHAVFPAELVLLLDAVGLEVIAALGADPTGGAPPHADDGSWHVVAGRTGHAVRAS